MPCFYAMKLSEASSKLSSEFFHTKWMLNHRKDRTSKIIFMENLQRDMVISTHGLFPLNLGSFLRILNAAYSLFAVVKNVDLELGQDEML